MINKKALISAVLVVTLALPIGCTVQKQDTGNNNEPTQQQSDAAGTVEENSSQETKIMDEFDTLIQNKSGLEEIIKFVDNNISFVSKENASVMADKLEKLQIEGLPQLEDKYYAGDTIQNKINEEFEPGTDINSFENVKDEELKKLLSETKASGYKVETAEGMFFPIINYEFYKKYSNYVTADIKAYIDIMAAESNGVPAKDAALVIEWDEVLNRALKQEIFINQYVDSIKINNIKQLYKNYVSYILFGLNNTPLFSYETKLMEEDAKSVYQNAIDNNDKSHLVETLREFFDVLEKNKYKLTDEVDNYRKNVYDAME